MKLIVGLGNPGRRCRFTRHNLGFLVIDRLSKINSIRLGRREYNSLLGTGRIGDEEVMLAKPLTYMNLSGEAIREIVAKEGVSLERMMIVCDDADLELGTIRIRARGSSSGHKGLESIAQGLGTEEFPRLRIGIGRREKAGLTEHVLTPFKKKDAELIRDLIERAVQALECWINSGIQAAMNRFN